MKVRFITLSLLALSCIDALAQNSKLATAWRNIEDYKSSKDISSLNKAKEAIDLATVNEDTKGKAKTWVYRSKVYYELFHNDINTEKAKLKSGNENEKNEIAFGNAPTANYEEAGKALNLALQLDKEKTYQTDLTMLSTQIIQDVNNLAYGKFKTDKYEESMKYFDEVYEFNKNIYGLKDTSSLYNAVLSANKAKSQDKVKTYSQKMISEKVAVPFTYQSLFDAYLMSKDTTNALNALKDGRKNFPNDTYLMNRETEFYLQQGKQKEALDNLDKGIAQDAGNGQLYLVRGNVYDNLGNKDKSNKKYEELVMKAEADYKKSTELIPNEFDPWYFLGALYNNWAVYFQDLASNDLKHAKEYDAKGADLLKKAIPPLEKAHQLKPDDTGTMNALRRLYLITNQPDKAEAMKKKLGK